MFLDFLQKYEMGRDIFCQKVKNIIFFLHTKFQRNQDWNSKVMIKTILYCVLMLTNCHKLPVRIVGAANFPSSLFHFCKASTPQNYVQESINVAKTSLS
jgi:hypothetical protein